MSVSERQARIDASMLTIPTPVLRLVVAVLLDLDRYVFLSEFNQIEIKFKLN